MNRPASNDLAAKSTHNAVNAQQQRPIQKQGTGTTTTQKRRGPTNKQQENRGPPPRPPRQAEAPADPPEELTWNFRTWREKYTCLIEQCKRDGLKDDAAIRKRYDALTEGFKGEKKKLQTVVALMQKEVDQATKEKDKAMEDAEKWKEEATNYLSEIRRLEKILKDARISKVIEILEGRPVGGGDEQREETPRQENREVEGNSKDGVHDGIRPSRVPVLTPGEVGSCLEAREGVYRLKKITPVKLPTKSKKADLFTTPLKRTRNDETTFQYSEQKSHIPSVARLSFQSGDINKKDAFKPLTSYDDNGMHYVLSSLEICGFRRYIVSEEEILFQHSALKESFSLLCSNFKKSSGAEIAYMPINIGQLANTLPDYLKSEIRFGKNMLDTFGAIIARSVIDQIEHHPTKRCSTHRSV